MDASGQQHKTALKQQGMKEKEECGGNGGRGGGDDQEAEDDFSDFY